MSSGWIAFAICVAITGCGRLDFGERRDGSIAGPGDASVMIDAACTQFGPWSAPQPISELASTSNDSGGQISPDGLTIYFDSDRVPLDNVFVTTRATRTSPFGTPVELPGIAGTYAAGDPSATGDQLELYFNTSDPVGCIYKTTRPDAASAWPAGHTVASLCPVNASTVYVSGDGLTMLYENGSFYLTTRTSRDVDFTPGTLLSSITTGNAASPSSSADGLTLYYQGDLPSEIYTATRPGLGAMFTNITELSSVDSGAYNLDATVTADGLEMFYASNVSGLLQLWRATRSCM